MGLLDQVIGAVGNMSGHAGNGNNALLNVVLQIVNNPQTGGLPGLIQSFQNGGLGDVIGSWVSTGRNLPVSPDQLQNVLGREQLQKLAAQFGLNSGQVSGQLAELMPQVIDKLTPNGAVPQQNELMAQGLELLKGKFFS